MTIFELLEKRHTKLLSQNQCRRQNAHSAVGLSTRVSYLVGQTVDPLDLKLNSKYCTALLNSPKRISYITSKQPTLALCHPLHYLTAANSCTLPPRYITPRQPTLALCHTIQPIIHDNSTTTNSSLPIPHT